MVVTSESHWLVIGAQRGSVECLVFAVPFISLSTCAIDTLLYCVYLMESSSPYVIVFVALVLLSYRHGYIVW